MGTNAIGAEVTPAQQARVAEALPVKQVGTAKPEANQTAQAQPNEVRSSLKPSSAALHEAVTQANHVLEAKTANELKFSIVKGAGIEVVKMVNQETGKTIMQFPSEKMIEIAKTIDQVSGAIIKVQA